MMSFPKNKTLKAAEQSPGMTWRWFGLTYLLYAGLFSLLSFLLPIFLPFLDPLSVSLLAFAPTSLVCVIFLLRLAKRSPQSLGMWPATFWSTYLPGWLLSGLVLAIIWLVTLAAGGLSFRLNSDFQALPFLLLWPGFIFQGFMEEFLFRSLLLTQISLKFNLLIAMLINSVFFGLGHLSNEAASVISVSNTILIGLVFSLMFYYHDNLWFVSGFHSGWNFILGPVLGVAVSGFDLPTSLLETDLNPQLAWFNGGAYGFEAGGLVTLLSIALIIIYLLLISKKKSLSQKEKNV